MNAICSYSSGVTDAKEWASALVLREMRCPGDLDNAMHRLERRYGIPWRTFWNLRYRPPTDVLVGVWRQLKSAYELECERQERLLAHERHVAEAQVLSFEAMDGPSSHSDSGGGD